MCLPCGSDGGDASQSSAKIVQESKHCGFHSGVYDTTDAGCLPCGEDSSEQGVKRGKSREEKSPPNCWVLVSAVR